MLTFRRDLPPDVGHAADHELTSQVDQSFERVIALDNRLTQHNFLVNAGGAVAVLAFLGARGDASFALWPLGAFIVGVVASGIELRALLIWSRRLHKDAIDRRARFSQNELELSAAVPPPDLAEGWSRLNHWAGLCSQALFAIGALLGFALVTCSGPTRQ